MTALRTATVWLAAAGLAAAQDAAQRGYLGVVTVRSPDGELVVSIDPQGPAAAAGQRAEDDLAVATAAVLAASLHW